MGINNPVPNSMPGPINQPMNQPMNPPTNQGGGFMGMIQNMIFNKMYQSNPKLPNSNITFRDIVSQSQGKTPEQAFQEQGLDYSQYQNIGPEQIKNMLGF